MVIMKLFCEREIRTFETQAHNTLNLSAITVVKQLTYLPVIINPSPAAGRPDIIPALSKVAVAVGSIRDGG